MPSGAIAGSFDKQHVASIFQLERGKGHYWFSVLSEIINKLNKWCVAFQEYFKYFTGKLKMKQKNEMNKQKTDTNNKKTERRHREFIFGEVIRRSNAYEE